MAFMLILSKIEGNTGVHVPETEWPGILWVVTMQHGEFVRMPDYEEKVIIETWPGRTIYSLFPRYYRMTDADGGELARVSSLWTHVVRKRDH